MIDGLLSVLEMQQEYAFWIIFLVAFAEACPGLGLFVSGAVFFLFHRFFIRVILSPYRSSW